METGKPLYEVIADDLRHQISSGQYSLTEPLCTEKSLSEQYEVSRITAKNAIQTLEQEGLVYRTRGIGTFVTDPAVQEGNQSRKHQTLALLMPFESSKGGAFQIIETASKHLAQEQAFLALHVTKPGYNSEQELLRFLGDSPVDGIAYYPSQQTLPRKELERFTIEERPIILLDKFFPDPEFSNIVSDNFSGAYQLTKHLIDYGHKKICYLSRFPAEGVSTIQERYRGYTQCLADNHIAFSPYFVKTEGLSEESVNYAMLMHIVNRLYQEGITAIVCENDEVAFYVAMCCSNLKIAIPEQMSLTGFDNIYWSTMGNFQITTIEQDFHQMGEEIATLFLSNSTEVQKKMLPVRFIPRASTGPAPK